MKSYRKKTEIQREIISLLNHRKECVFGTFVKELNYSYQEVLENVIELNQRGKILKLEKYRGNYVLPL